MGLGCQILWPHKYNVKQLENQPKKQFFHGLEKKVFAQMDLFFIDHEFCRVLISIVSNTLIPKNKKIIFPPK